MLRINSVLKPLSEPLIRLCKPCFSKQVIDEIEYALSLGLLREASNTERFETCFKKRVKARYAYSVSSGTAALQVALMSCLPRGSKVLVPAFSFIASASSIINAGCKPVFVDVDPDSFLLDLDDAWEKVDEYTRGIMPVHLFGNVVDYDGLVEISEEYDLKIIHDCAQAMGSQFRSMELGELWDLCCYSFYPTKIIAVGEGGMVTTNDEEYSYRGRLLKSHGESEKYHHTVLGYNYRSNEISSILGLDQMTHLEQVLEKRRGHANYYDVAINNIQGIEPQRITDDVVSCYNYYTVKVTPNSGLERNQIVKDLFNMHIEAAVHYPRALTQQPALDKYTSNKCPVAEELAESVFSIPIHPYLTDKQKKLVVLGLRTAVNRYL